MLKGHHDVIPVLVQREADVNQASGPWVWNKFLLICLVIIWAKLILLIICGGHRMNNTALHEAAAMENEGLRSVEILLGWVSLTLMVIKLQWHVLKNISFLWRCNASIRKHNNHGQTAYDIAVAAGSNSVVSLMAAHMGQDLLQRHTKARSPSGLDTFSWENPHLNQSKSQLTYSSENIDYYSELTE